MIASAVSSTVLNSVQDESPRAARGMSAMANTASDRGDNRLQTCTGEGLGAPGADTSAVQVGWRHSRETESGEGGIRTLGLVAQTPVFETGPIGRSGTSPGIWPALSRSLSKRCHAQPSTRREFSSTGGQGVQRLDGYLEAILTARGADV